MIIFLWFVFCVMNQPLFEFFVLFNYKNIEFWHLNTWTIRIHLSKPLFMIALFSGAFIEVVKQSGRYFFFLYRTWNHQRVETRLWDKLHDRLKLEPTLFKTFPFCYSVTLAVCEWNRILKLYKLVLMNKNSVKNDLQLLRSYFKCMITHNASFFYFFCYVSYHLL